MIPLIDLDPLTLVFLDRRSQRGELHQAVNKLHMKRLALAELEAIRARVKIRQALFVDVETLPWALDLVTAVVVLLVALPEYV